MRTSPAARRVASDLRRSPDVVEARLAVLLGLANLPLLAMAVAYDPVLVLLVLLAPLSLLGSLRWLREALLARARLRRCRPVVAEVVSVQEHHAAALLCLPLPDEGYLAVRFRTAAGDDVEALSRTPARKRPPGTSVEVLHDPEEPTAVFSPGADGRLLLQALGVVAFGAYLQGGVAVALVPRFLAGGAG